MEVRKGGKKQIFTTRKLKDEEVFEYLEEKEECGFMV
jgi:hypothetical protein